MPILGEHRLDWMRDCLKWRGRVLEGEHTHWCDDWDGLPVDETTPEWPCNCFTTTDCGAYVTNLEEWEMYSRGIGK
jgi:hypothetical protein